MKQKFVLFGIIICLLFVNIPVYASGSFIEQLAGSDDIHPGANDINAEITKNVGHLYTTIQKAGIVIAVLVTVASGVQWIVATPAKKAELKGKMIAIAVGVALILLASTLVGLVGNMWQNTLVK